MTDISLDTVAGPVDHPVQSKNATSGYDGSGTRSPTVQLYMTPKMWKYSQGNVPRANSLFKHTFVSVVVL